MNKINVFILQTLFITISLIFLEPAYALDPLCTNIAVSITPNKTTYLPQETVTVTVSGLTNTQGSIRLYYAPTSANTQTPPSPLPSASPLPKEWKEIAGVLYNPTAQTWSVNWTIPNFSDEFPTNHNSQEFFLVANVANTLNQLVCSGNPDPGPAYSYLMCNNCRKIVVSYTPPVQPLDLFNFYKVIPGYSWTYEGERLDDVVDDNGQIIHPTSTSRWEIEAPVDLCGKKELAMRMTKTNRWGYWSRASRDPAQRTGFWSSGQHNLRFFVDAPEGPWNPNFWGSLGHKIYTLPANGLTDLGSLERVLVQSSFNLENYYYPPYFLSPRYAETGGTWEFMRADSIYYKNNADGTPSEDASIFCRPELKNQQHAWRYRIEELTDPDVLAEFSYWRNLYPNKKIVVWVFFEYSSGQQPNFREDWYLMQDVGFVGMDQKNGCLACTQQGTPIDPQYLTARFMKRTDPTLRPDVTMRAVRAYLGGALSVKIEPLAILQAGSYTFHAQSTGPGEIPYDGYVEYQNQHNPNDARLWGPYWLTDGQTQVTPNLPPGYYYNSFRPRIINNFSSFETQLAFTPNPWSNTTGIWILDTAEMTEWDLDNSQTVTLDDFKTRITQYSQTKNVYSLGQFIGKFCRNGACQ